MALRYCIRINEVCGCCVKRALQGKVVPALDRPPGTSESKGLLCWGEVRWGLCVPWAAFSNREGPLRTPKILNDLWE